MLTRAQERNSPPLSAQFRQLASERSVAHDDEVRLLVLAVWAVECVDDIRQQRETLLCGNAADVQHDLQVGAAGG